MSATAAREIPSAKGVPHRKGSALLAYLDAAGMRGSLFPSFFSSSTNSRGAKNRRKLLLLNTLKINFLLWLNSRPFDTYANIALDYWVKNAPLRGPLS